MDYDSSHIFKDEACKFYKRKSSPSREKMLLKINEKAVYKLS